MIRFKQKGDFSKTKTFMEKTLNIIHLGMLDRYGREGVNLLRTATPRDTGLTASSWEYKINRSGDRVAIEWYNTNSVDGVNIAVIIQYGHGTRNGAYVQGVDYINPAMQPLFDEIAQDIWKEVTNA